MKDSQLGYAKLQEVEPKTMQYFLEFIYTGFYQVEKEIIDTPEADETDPSTKTPSKHCTRCGILSYQVCQRTPHCTSATCKDGYLSGSYLCCIGCGGYELSANTAYCTFCRRRLLAEDLKDQGAKSRANAWGFRIRTTSGPFTVKASNFDIDVTATDIEVGLRHATLDDDCPIEILDCRITTRHPHVVAAIVFAKSTMADAAIKAFRRQRFGKQTISAEHVLETSKQYAFEKRKYDVGKIQHKDFSKNLKYRTPAVPFSGRLLPHAELWVFADRYLVNDLKDLCLHMLYRELLVFKINSASVFQVFELLSYVYDPEHTVQSDDETKDKGEEVYVNELRDLVISYAACIFDELREFNEYREALHNGGDLAAVLGSLKA